MVQPKIPRPINRTVIKSLFAHRHHPMPQQQQQQQAAIAQFDLYVLAQEWLPNFCCKRQNRCPNITPHHFLAQHLGLHGLWPSNADGSWPRRCKVVAHGGKNKGQAYSNLPVEAHYHVNRYAANLEESKAFAEVASISFLSSGSRSSK